MHARAVDRLAAATIDFMSTVEEVRDLNTLVSRLLALTEPLGVRHVGMVDVMAARLDALAGIRFTTFPREWVDSYFRHRRERIDPVWLEGLRASAPNFWALETGGSAAGTEWSDFYRSIRLNGGMTTPVIAATRRRLALFLLAEEPFPTDAATRATLALAASAFGARAVELLPPIANETLTVRETEILTLIALGESARGVAKRLSLAEKTVVRHLLHVRDKLGAANTVEAVARAVRAELIAI